MIAIPETTIDTDPGFKGTKLPGVIICPDCDWATIYLVRTLIPEEIVAKVERWLNNGDVGRALCAGCGTSLINSAILVR